MADVQSQSPKEVRELFEEACAKFWRWKELDERENFDISSSCKEDLEKLLVEYPTPEAIRKFNEEVSGITSFEETKKEYEEQVFYNDVVDRADEIYAEILRLAKIIAPDPEALGFGAEKFWVELCNMGTFKYDIDWEKSFNEEMAGEPVYPVTQKVEPIPDEEDLRKFLLG